MVDPRPARFHSKSSIRVKVLGILDALTTAKELRRGFQMRGFTEDPQWRPLEKKGEPRGTEKNQNYTAHGTLQHFKTLINTNEDKSLKENKHIQNRANLHVI